MATIEVLEPGVSRGNRGMRLLDVRGLDVETDGWVPIYLVYSGYGRAGVIEFEQVTEYYKFTPARASPGMPGLGDFSIDVLKRRVAEWLASKANA